MLTLDAVQGAGSTSPRAGPGHALTLARCFVRGPMHRQARRRSVVVAVDSGDPLKNSSGCSLVTPLTRLFGKKDKTVAPTYGAALLE